MKHSVTEFILIHKPRKHPERLVVCRSVSSLNIQTMLYECIILERLNTGKIKRNDLANTTMQTNVVGRQLKCKDRMNKLTKIQKNVIQKNVKRSVERRKALYP